MNKENRRYAVEPETPAGGFGLRWDRPDRQRELAFLSGLEDALPAQMTSTDDPFLSGLEDVPLVRSTAEDQRREQLEMRKSGYMEPTPGTPAANGYTPTADFAPATPGRTSLDYSPDEGIFTWNGKQYGSVDKLREDAVSAGLTMDELGTLEKKLDVYGFGKNYAGGEPTAGANDWSNILTRPDFEEYAQRGAAIENPTYDQANSGLWLFSKNLFGKTPKNIVTFSQDNADRIFDTLSLDGGRSPGAGNYMYTYVTGDETKIYNYLLAKYGGEEAQKYLDSLTETLNQRNGGEVAENIRNIQDPVSRAAMTGITGVEAGMGRYASGVRQFFNNEEQPTSAGQYASAYINEDLADKGAKIAGHSIGQTLYEAAVNFGNMMPSMMIGLMTGGAGSAVSTGIATAGNTYKEKLAEGKNKNGARLYSAMVGALEGYLNYALSGIGSVTGLGEEAILAKIACIDNALARAALTGGTKIGGEVLEEELQDVLAPVFEGLIFKEKYKGPSFSDMAYTAILTTLTTLVLSGRTIIDAGISGVDDGRNTEPTIENVETTEYNSIDEDEANGVYLQQKDYVENAPCVTTPKKITGYLLKEGAKHSDQFFDVGYTADNPMQLRYDISRQFDMANATDVIVLENGAVKFNIYMELGVTKTRWFLTGWMIDMPNDPPRLLTAFRKEKP